MTASDNDPLIPVMLPTSVVNRLDADRLSGAIDPRVLKVVGDACHDALSKRVTIEILESTRDVYATGLPPWDVDGGLAAHDDMTAACRASRDAEAQT